MSMVLEIPDQIARAMRLPVSGQQQSLMMELAIALYARGILSFGKACELTPFNRVEFGLLLGRRDIPRHYCGQDLEDDIAYARDQ
uniref:Predicted antitoxin, contains HTH domain n=1 Tax=Candidatus Kentrum sp. DK TaxID=2126562 RepID=A0A450SQI9_9GAMM|nr:MAG: Predicted antitoxin, contains HTH domain [Candidatus Kentron sp. DK]VFJ61507.1 MAG: Predicted antitoxin, contains HTH domain [Candidatus Kentron sp. DK]